LRTAVEIGVSGVSVPSVVKPALFEAAEKISRHTEIELVHIDADAARYRVTTELDDGKTPGDLRLALVDALAEAGIALSRERGPRA
jgi:hypothetical protein